MKKVIRSTRKFKALVSLNMVLNTYVQEIKNDYIIEIANLKKQISNLEYENSVLENKLALAEEKNNILKYETEKVKNNDVIIIKENKDEVKNEENKDETKEEPFVINNNKKRGRGNAYTFEEMEFLKKSIKNGVSFKEIASKLSGRHSSKSISSTIYNIRHNTREDFFYKIYDKSETEKLIEMYNLGYTIEEMKEYLNSENHYQRNEISIISKLYELEKKGKIKNFRLKDLKDKGRIINKAANENIKNLRDVKKLKFVEIAKLYKTTEAAIIRKYYNIKNS